MLTPIIVGYARETTATMTAVGHGITLTLRLRINRQAERVTGLHSQAIEG